MKKTLIILLTLFLITSCGKTIPQKDSNITLKQDTITSPTKVIYHASYSGGYIFGLSQSLNNIIIDDNIKFLTVFVGFNVNEYGGAFGSFQIYLENLLETNIPTYGVIAPHRTKDVKTSFYYASFYPSVIIDDNNNKRITIKAHEIYYRDGAITNNKLNVNDYGITKVIGHY
ncbi:hypothetical protein EZS27_007738 [termite gut metagenome]|uniref:Lipoprotein n=1 Tax=termite gut metagenome TaxID=433724 RepID=A0A5J4SFH0_9ZZZZ